MNKFVLLIAPLSLVACVTVSEDTPGRILEFNGASVRIAGGLPQGASTARPTEAIIAQAQSVCPDARYLGASPTPGDYVVEFEYLFAC